MLDERVASFGPAHRFTPPRAGWVRAIREALGMSAEQLAKRMGVTRQALNQLEASEVDGVAQLRTLSRAANALNCTLVYAFIPDTTLADILEEQAARVLDAQVGRVAHSMALEDQSAVLSPLARADAIASLLDSRRLWSVQTSSETASQ